MYDVIIIGAGQAGLASGYYLKQKNMRFLILDAAAAIGHSWRNRYDSLQLFTPRMYDRLPGMPMKGDQNGLPYKDEVAEYLHSYVEYNKLPIQLNCRVNRITKSNQSFIIESSQGTYTAQHVIVATGPFQVKNVPAFATAFSDTVIQLHSSEYVNPEQLCEGNTIIVGGGNSGAQIAVEVAQDQHAQRAVYLSTSHSMSFKPLYIMKRSIFWYFEKLGVIRADKHRIVGRWLRKQADFIYGFELKQLLQQSTVKLLPRSKNAHANRVIFEDGTELEVSNVIWATGFKSDYSWLDIPNAFDSNKQIVHDAGVSPVQGLYYVGLPWQTSRGSALLGWVKYDAERIVSHINL